MNRDSLLKGIFWVIAVASFAGLIAASYMIYTGQVDKIEILKKNLKETHRILKETKGQLFETKNNTSILAAKKDGLIKKVSIQKDRIEKFQQEKKNLEDKTKGLKAQKRELEVTLEKTRKSLKEQIKSQELKIAELEEDFQKKSAMEKAMFSAQEKKLNEQVMAAEVLLEVLTKQNKELVGKANENRQLLVHLIENEEDESGTQDKPVTDKAADKAVQQARGLKEKLSDLNNMIEQNKKLIAKNEKIIINVTNEKERIAGKLQQTEDQFKKDAFKLHYNLGLAYDESRQYDEALVEYKKALELHKLDPDLHYNMAIIYDEHFHDRANAIEHYEAYLKLSPSAEDAAKVAHWLEQAKKNLEYTPRRKVF